MKLTIIIALVTILNTISLGQVYVRPTSTPVERPRIVKTSSSTSAIRKFSATAYCLSKNKMANGKRVFSGAVAADPRVLPLGTRIEIIGMGQYVVSDTGGKIKGNIIDVWFKSCTEAKRFGRKVVQIILL